MSGVVVNVWAERNPPTDHPSERTADGLQTADGLLASKRTPIEKPSSGAHSSASISIHRPVGPPQIATGMTNLAGEPITVGCRNCHATRPPNPANKSVADLDEFHGSMKLHHGNISCLSCHNGEDYDALKLADGTRIEFSDVMELCSQCHGPQRRDYEHGLHGGMRGYWDASKGGKQKNNCVDCHYPHAPQFPHMFPTFKPRDRFLNPPHAEDAASLHSDAPTHSDAPDSVNRPTPSVHPDDLESGTGLP